MKALKLSIAGNPVVFFHRTCGFLLDFFVDGYTLKIINIVKPKSWRFFFQHDFPCQTPVMFRFKCLEFVG